MNAKLYGFQWVLGHGIKLDQFFGHLKGCKDNPIKWKPYDRLLYTCDYDKYYGGLVLSVKDQRKFPEIKQDGQQFTISVREMEKNTNAIDFNFFAVNKKTHRGAYLHYHQSFGMNQFNAMCARQYKVHKQSRIDEELGKLSSHTRTDEAKAKLGEKYKGRLSYETIIREEDLPDLISDLKRISAFEFDYAVLNPQDSWAKPLEEGARRKTYRYGFAPQKPVGQIKDMVVNAVKQAGITKGRIEGKGENNEDQVLNLANNPSSFGEYDHDMLAGEMAFDLSNLKNCWCMEQVMKNVESNKAFFE